MKGKAKSFWIGLCGVISAFCFITGVWSGQPTVDVSASGTPTVTMVAGASARTTENDPGIKFTATIHDYVAPNANLQYGMLILPESAWGKLDWNNDTQYHQYFAENNITNFADSICGPYVNKDTGERQISFSLRNINDSNFDMSFVGIAYTLIDGTYDYADVNLVENGRSISYVAQMALQYEQNLSDSQRLALENYVGGNVGVDKDDYLTGDNMEIGGDTIAPNYAMKYIPNATDELGLITKEAYAGGSKVSFKYFIPEGTKAGWWGIAWHTDASQANNYHAAGAEKAMGYQALGTVVGVWVNAEFTLPAGNSYYLYFGSETGNKDNNNWTVNGEASYVLIDDFTVGNKTETFGESITDSIFNVKKPEKVMTEKAGDYGFGSSPGGEYVTQTSAKIIVDKLSSDAGTASFITKDKYSAGTEVSFMYYVPADVTSSWFAVCGVANSNNTNIYENWLWQGSLTKGSWQTMTVTLKADGYIHFAGAVGDWGGKDTPKTEGYVLIDNFAVDGEVVEDFNNGVEDSIFNVNTAGAIVDGEGYVTPPEANEMVGFSGAAIGGNERIAMITKNAHSGVTEITFEAVWTGDCTSARWGLSYTTDPTKFSYGAEVNAINCYTPKLGGLKMDAGVAYTYKFTFTNNAYVLYAKTGDSEYAQISNGDYTQGNNYFYLMVCPAVGGNGVIFYMDNFTITTASGTVTDTFNNSASSLFCESSQKNTNYGSTGMSFELSTFVESGEQEPETPDLEEIGELAMKLLLNQGDDGVRVRTTNAYAGGSKVEFKYYIQANQATQWTRFIWDTDTSCDNYASTYTSFGNTAGNWVTWSYTLPSGGPYYLYFGFECGNWKDSSGTPYILIDDFTVNGEVETFNYGVENSAFTILQTNLAGNSEDGEGYYVKEEPLAAKLTIDLISSTANTPSFITAEKWAGNVTVTFDYYMSGNTNNKWWTLNWTTNNTSANIYAFVEPTDTNNGVSLPVLQDGWQTASVEIPAGDWYFYFAGAVGEWSNGYVLIDNFKIGDVYTETFNYGYGIFLDNRDSKPDAITLVEGKEDFKPGEYAMKYIPNATDAVGAITKQAYAGGSKVSFKYFIPEGTTTGWWGIAWRTGASEANNYHAAGVENALGYKALGVVAGEWVDVEFTLPAGGPYYLYFGNEVGNNWKLNGENAYILIDNFTVSGETETFNFGMEESIFDVKDSSKVLLSDLGEGFVGDETETPDVPVEPEIPVLPESGDNYALVNLMKDPEKLNAYMEAGGYASIFTSNSIESTDLPLPRVFLEGRIGYAMTGEKEFAIYFGNGAFIFVNGSVVAFYADGKIVSYFEAEKTTATLAFTVTKGGKLNVSLGGAWIGMGMMTEPNVVKLVALGGGGEVKFSEITVRAYTLTFMLEDVPAYFSLEGIDITAYAFDSEAMVSEAGFKALAEAGFTKTLALLQGRMTNGDLHEQDIPDRAHVENLMAEVNADALAALELAEKYGMKHYVMNSNLYNIERNPNNYQWLDDFAELATYTLSQAFAGHFLADEPQSGNWFTTSELGELVNAYKAYKTAFPNSEAFINLLPRESTQFTSESLYEDYVDTYIETLALDYNGVPGTGYVSFDHYPLRDGSLTSTHLRNLELIAGKCRDNNLELRFYIKASTTGDSERSIRATESVNDLYMQIYSGLAYGAKEIVYYQYTDHTQLDGTPGDAVMSGTSLEKGNVYNWAKQVNNEVHGFEKAYMNFTWKSTSVFGKTSLTQFNNLKNKASVYGYISSVSSSASVLVGNFDDTDGSYSYGAKNAYMVVNYGNTEDATSATTAVTITFNGTPKRALVYQKGLPTVVTLSGNVLTLNLMLGEGAFVIPLV